MSTITLPPEKLFSLRSTLENGWSDNYGAVHIAARYAGLELEGQPYFLRGVWQHGVFGPWQENVPETLAYATPLFTKWPLFVARAEQVAALRAAGAGEVAAIGMPFAYVPPSGLQRQAGALLVVPTHTLVGATFEDRRPFERYAAYINSIAGRFSRVVACVHPSCQQNGLWITEFARHGIEVVAGAKVNDLQSLPRVRALFDQFEYVTTNGWGSHVAYALACGAKVSIHGESIEDSPEARRNWLKRDVTWASRPDLLEAVHNPEVFARRRAYLERLYREPHLAEADVAWGEWWIGAGHKLSPADVRSWLARWVDTDWKFARGAAGMETGRTRRLFICHEASRTGAPINLLNFLRWLRTETEQGFDVLLGKDGPLKDELLKVATVFDPNALPGLRPRLAGYTLIYANTVCCGRLISRLGAALPPVVTHVHELDCAYDIMGPAMMSQMLTQSRRLLACSEQVKARLSARFGVPAEEIDVTPETCAPAEVRELAKAPPQAALSWPADTFLVVGCGTCDVRKGADLFLQVAARVRRGWHDARPLKFVWIGLREECNFSRHLRDDTRKLGLDAVVEWWPVWKNPFPLLQRATVFCLSSREDPYPLVMLEAAALGVPVVAFKDAGGGEDFCARGAGVSVPYMDQDGMAAELLALAGDMARCGRLGAEGRRLVEERHETGVVAAALQARLCAWERGGWPAPQTLAQTCARYPAKAGADWGAYLAVVRFAGEAITQARRQVAAGDRAGGAKHLVQSASRALSVGDAGLIVVGLAVLGEALAAIEPSQGKYLLGEAEKMASSRGLVWDDYRTPVWLTPP